MTEEDVAIALRGFTDDHQVIELRRAPATVARNARARGGLDGLDEGGVRAFDDLPPGAARTLAEAAQDARARAARGGADQLDATERRLIETADRLAEEARAVDTAWREAPPRRGCRGR